MRMTIYAFILVFLPPLTGTSLAAEEGCYDLPKENPERNFASDYPYPISMRWNIVKALENKLLELGEISKPRQDDRRPMPQSRILQLQQKLGLRESGCINWELVNSFLATG
jgi:hypothetical protein